MALLLLPLREEHTPMRLPSPALLALLLACKQPDKPNFGSEPPLSETDDDADGYTADIDCDDGDADVSPSGTEICDGVDDDCDGLVDEEGTPDALQWFQDDDGDDHGAGAGRVACYPPDDTWVATDDDCDDTDPEVYPGAPETCDGEDDDCDGDLDEDPIDPETWYGDLDHDGYGDADNTLLACDQPENYLIDGDDCDDHDEHVHPDAREICNGVDDDCDDQTDEVGAEGYMDADGDGYGDPDEPVVTCEDMPLAVADDTDCDDTDEAVFPGADELGNGYDDDCDGFVDEGTSGADDDGDGYSEDEGDCDDTDAGIAPDAAEICGDGVDQNCDGATNGCELSGDVSGADATAVMTGVSADDHAGGWLALPGDVNGDGVGDLLVCASDADGVGVDAGAAYLVLGPLSGALSLSDADADVAGQAGDQLGAGASGPGDLDRDGYDDLVIGAPGADDGASGAGAAWIFLGPLSGALDGGAAEAGVIGLGTDDALGVSVAGLGDSDGDGWSDLILGVRGDDSGAINAGGATIVTAPLDEVVGADGALGSLLGTTRGDLAGSVVAGGGDTDGDGVRDVAIGAPKSDLGGANSGAAYAVLGPVDGTVSLLDADATVAGSAAGDEAGTALDWLGDLDGDGLDDLGVGAPYEDSPSTDAGAAAVLFGPVSGGWTVAGADVYLPGLVAKDRAGQAITGAGDLDGDGVDDLIVTAFYDDTAARNAGAAYLIYGPLSAGATLDLSDARLLGEAEDDRLGGAAAGGGDADGDGAQDLLLGAHLSDRGATDGGAAYLFRGGGI